MGYLRRVLFLLLIAAGASLCPSLAFAATHYVAGAELPPQFLPPPPAEGSAAWKQNIDGVLAAQKHISRADIAAMRDEQHMRIGLVADVLGPGFTRAAYPHTFELLDGVLEDSEAIADADKRYWHTRRPYLTDARVKLMVDPIDQSPAFPSGHTAGSRVLAEVLGMIDPDRLADLRAKADSIAYHRIEAGVHYPGDVEGGHLLAMLIVGALANSDAFQSDLAAAREEIKR